MPLRLKAVVWNALLTVVATPCGGAGQVVASRSPVIDMHVHSTSGSPQEQLARMQELNVRYIWLTGLAPDFPTWAKALPESQFLQTLILPCIARRSPFVARPCWEGTADFPDTTWLREELRTERVKALGEMPRSCSGSPRPIRVSSRTGLSPRNSMSRSPFIWDRVRPTPLMSGDTSFPSPGWR